MEEEENKQIEKFQQIITDLHAENKELSEKNDSLSRQATDANERLRRRTIFVTKSIEKMAQTLRQQHREEIAYLSAQMSRQKIAQENRVVRLNDEIHQLRQQLMSTGSLEE